MQGVVLRKEKQNAVKQNGYVGFNACNCCALSFTRVQGVKVHFCIPYIYRRYYMPAVEINFILCNRNDSDVFTCEDNML